MSEYCEWCGKTDPRPHLEGCPYRESEEVWEFAEKLKKQRDSAEAKVKELETRLADLRRPTHGPCCTCRRCGKLYEDCRCDLDAVADDLAKAEARVKELKQALRDLMAWGVEHDDPRIKYITVQVDRVTIEAAERALRGEEER